VIPTYILKGGENMEQKDMKNLPEPHKTVASLIRVGKENATLLSDIMSIAEIGERRIAARIIEDLINRHGYVIGASKSGKFKGYYIPANEKEFKEVIQSFKRTINAMEVRYKNLKSNYEKGA